MVEPRQLLLPLAGESTAAQVFNLGHGRRSIETDFPVLEVSRLARMESYRKNIYRPAYYIHKWWARRTGGAFRALLLGTLLPEGVSPLDFFYRPGAFKDVVILDPFMGGGTTVGEALRLGARAIGVDINPVSHFLVKKVVEPVSLPDLERAYRFLEQTVGREILRLYGTTCPRCRQPAQAVYTYWVKQIPCQNCGREVPLRKSWVLARHMSRPRTGLVTCPACGYPYISSTLPAEQRCLSCQANFNPEVGFSRGAGYTCPACGHRGRILEALALEPPPHSMVAIFYLCPGCGQGYKQPDEYDIAAYEQIRARFLSEKEDLLFPREEIRPGYNTNQMRNYRYRYWSQMFNERQLLGLSMLLKAILRIEDPNVMEQMLLLFSGTLEFNNMFCSPKGLGTGAVRPLFAHHAFIPAKEPLEANLWGVHRSSGGFSTLYQERLRRGKAYAKRPVERRLERRVPMPGERIESPLATSFAQLMTSPDHRVLLLNRSSTCLAEIPSRSVDAVVTAPPYWSNVMYSELADFFYVWLRLVLRERYPEFAPPSARREDEAIVNPEQDKEAGSYREILSAVFQECHRVLKDEGLLVFTFHHGTAEAWDALAEALRVAGFAIQRVWPVYAEMDVGVPIWGKESVKFDAILVCRKGGAWGVANAGMETEALVNAVRKEVRALVKRLESEFSLSQRDWSSLARAVAAMFYTRGETTLLPSAVDCPGE